uniref:Uncharacterized protein n=1 Tax=Anopheles minimus TaxID=112268 RepID=A0A182VWL9_9DIPT
MTPSKLRIKDDLYNRLAPSHTDEMLYKAVKTRSSNYFHTDEAAPRHDQQASSDETHPCATGCPSQMLKERITTRHSPTHREECDNVDTGIAPKSAFIFPAQFYKNLFAASASLLKKQQPRSDPCRQYEGDHSEDEAGIDEQAEDLSNPTTLETTLSSVGQFPRSLFPSASSSQVQAQQESTTEGAHPDIDRDVDTSESNEILEKPSNAFPWLSEATNNNDYTKGNNNHHGTPPHLHPHHPHHHHHHHHPHHSHHPHLPHSATSAGSQSNLGAAASSSLATGNCRHGHPEDTKCRSLNCGPPQSPTASSSLAANEGATPDSSSTTATATAIPNFNQMPVPGGVQGQNPTQGLVHWMSAVMAEHMTSNPHHDPAAVGMHYMWNGPVE